MSILAFCILKFKLKGFTQSSLISLTFCIDEHLHDLLYVEEHTIMQLQLTFHVLRN